MFRVEFVDENCFAKDADSRATFKELEVKIDELINVLNFKR